MDPITGLVAGMLALGWLFWAILGVIIIAAIVSVESERFVITTPVVVVGVALLVWLSGQPVGPVFAWLRDNLGTVLFYAAVYLAVGVLYGVARYALFLRRIRDRFTAWTRDRKILAGAITQSQANEFKNLAGLKNFPIKISDSRKRILFWMVYWPLSMPWTVINEPVKRFFDFAYYRVAGMLQRLSDRMFSDVTIVNDPPKEPKETDDRPRNSWAVDRP